MCAMRYKPEKQARFFIASIVPVERQVKIDINLCHCEYLKLLTVLSLIYFPDSSIAVTWQHCDWDGWADPVCSEHRCPGSVPQPAASPKDQHPEGSGLDSVQHHGWQGHPDPGGCQRRADAHPGWDPPTGQKAKEERNIYILKLTSTVTYISPTFLWHAAD